MYEWIKNFPQQLKEAVGLCQSNNISLLVNSNTPLQHIVIAGMGSSLLPGILVRQWLQDDLTIPLHVNHDYNLPAYVSQHSLLIILSYSGNTQETIRILKKGIEQKAAIIVISSGGLLQTLAHEQGIPYLSLPPGLPPRAALAYSLTQLLYTLSRVQSLRYNFQTTLLHAASELEAKQLSIQPIALAVAKKLRGCIPVIYTPYHYEGAALRLRQQLNENSKQLCWHHTLPELTHNEIMGWQHTNQRIAVLLLTGPTLSEPLAQQQRAFEKIVRKCTDNFTTVIAQGHSVLIQTLYLIHLSDWISLYVAQEKKVDPMNITFIEQIKEDLKGSLA